MAAYDAAEAKFGTVDTVVANAGIAKAGRSTDLSAAAT
jgi:NADP-dependent 3-hydroxy acid dehydrogenase YdfG